MIADVFSDERTRDHVMNSQPTLILASSSPRRRSLMREYGYDVELLAPTVEEPSLIETGGSPAQRAQALSYFKAASVARHREFGWVIGGDTVVALGDEVFGKPVDRDDAGRILGRLAGTTHEVLTGLAIIDAGSSRRLISHDVTLIEMRSLSSAEMEAYLDTEAWVGKAGAYGIQDHGDAFVTNISGSFTNVVGMPMELLAGMLSRWDYADSTPRES